MEDEIKIRVARRSDFLQIAGLIAEQNHTPERQCIHGSAGEGPEGVLHEMLKWDEIGEIIFVAAVQNERVLGVLGSEFDEELGRGWLWGPYALVEEWEALTSALYQKLLEALPASIRQLDSFLNILNRRGRDFYLNQGFMEENPSHVYYAERTAALLAAPEGCSPLAPEHHQGFIALHEAIFPNAYYSAERVIDQIDDQNKVFVYVEGGQALGYVYASVSSDSEAGEVEFLGVREDARGQGIGKLLLQTALEWLFMQKGVSPVVLTVNEENVNARSLYEGVGFQLKYTGVSAQRKW